MKRFALALVAVFFFFGCGQQPATQEEAVIETIEIAELISNPLDFQEQTVRIEGIITHICRHSGDKMRVAEIEGDGLSVLVMLGDFAPEFNPEFEGKEVVLTGILKATIRNIDALAEGHVHGEDCDHEGEEVAHTEEGHDECASTQEAIAKMKEAGIDPDIATHIQITSFEIK